MVACSSDDEAASVEQRPDGKVPVRLHLRVAGEGDGSHFNTRAPWKDANATDDEMMNVWTVIAVHAEDDTETPKRFETGDIAFIHASIPAADKREIDDLVYLEPGKYDFYNFANFEPGVVTGILGIPDTERFLTPVNSNGAPSATVEFPYLDFFSDFGAGYTGPLDIYGVYSLTWGNTSDLKIKLHDYYTDGDNSGDTGVASTSVQVNGNGFDPTASDNGFQSKGIPMSNYQQITVTGEEDVDLIVVRMMAKIELQIQNTGSNPVTITTASLTDITDNTEGTTDSNIMLLPKYTNPASANTMNNVHKDIRPNLYKDATKGNFTHNVDKTIAEGATETVIFYVNESEHPINNTSATIGNGTGLFYLTLGIKTGNGQEVVYSHALINQKGSTAADNDAWDYIARNDYRVIPVVLTDWLFRVEPLAFVPIAGYPPVTLSSDAQKATFSTGGMIALQPFVKKRTDATWRDFSDPEVELLSITWTNSDDTETESSISGDGKIIKTAFAYDPISHCIIGELNNSKSGGPHKTAVTITVKLGPSTGPQYTYSFTCDVILDKR